MNMSVCHLLLWRPTLPYNWGNLNYCQPMRLSTDFSLEFPRLHCCTCLSCCSDGPPWNPEGRNTNLKKGIYLDCPFSKTLMSLALAMARKSVSRTSSFLWRLYVTFEICFSCVTLTDQDDALSAATSFYVGGAWWGWLCPIQWTASCSTHTWWHHHWSLVLRPSSTSCWQGNFVFLCLLVSTEWFMCHNFEEFTCCDI